MEFVLISPTKMKIMMDAEDMKRYALDAADMQYEQAQTRVALRKILSEAKETKGFDATGERVLIQVYPSKDGGCEIFVCRLSEEESMELKSKGEGDAEQESAIKAIQTDRLVREELSREENEDAVLPLYAVAFRFDSGERLLAVCLALYKRGYAERSSIYYEEGEGEDEGAYYLLLEESCRYRLRGISELSFIEEYGERLAVNGVRLSYIKEQYRLLAETCAVESIGRAETRGKQ